MKKFAFILLPIILGGFFLFTLNVYGADSDIVITEIGAYEPAGHEWVEIFNKGNTGVDLEGWKFWENKTNHRLTLKRGEDMVIGPGEYAVITQNDDNFISDYPNVDVRIIDSSWNSLKESGEEIGLKDSEGNFIERFTYIPAKDFALERIDAGIYDYTENNWFEYFGGNTAGAKNAGAPQNTLDDNNGGQQTDNADISDNTDDTESGAELISYPVGSVVINELVVDPADGEVEFIELFSKFGEPIGLEGWTVEDGGGASTRLSGVISPYGFFVVEKPKGNLNNKGDSAALFDPAGGIIDQVAYGSWDDGNLDDNAPAVKDPLSLARKYDGQDSDYDIYDFAPTEKITKGASNIIFITENSRGIHDENDWRRADFEHVEVVVNEIFPNPIGSDRDDEFIEIKNLDENAVNLDGWVIGDASKKTYTIADLELKSGGIAVFSRQKTHIALNNSGSENVKLLAPDGSLVDLVSYSGKAFEGYSYARTGEGLFSWTLEPTFGEENIIKRPNKPPVVVIDAETEIFVGEKAVFDASDTTDAEGDILEFEWSFPDQAKVDNGGGSTDNVGLVFYNEGVYTIGLKVSDGENVVGKNVVVTVFNGKDFTARSFRKVAADLADDMNSMNVKALDGIDKIVISEFVPNPKGPDTTEFIELYNRGNESADLSGFKLDDEDGGSRPYVIPKGTLIGPGEYMVFGKQETKIILNNSSDSARLLYPDGEVIHDIGYSDVIEGASYALNDEDMWVWSGKITPGEKNDIMPVSRSSGAGRTRIYQKRAKPVIFTSLADIRSFDAGDPVKVIGKVAVEPGILGARYFYIVSEESGSASDEPRAGIQVYMHKKGFPDLKIGDKIETAGEISLAYGEVRLKVKSKSDIIKLESGGAPNPEIVAIEDIGAEYEGRLVMVEGEVTEIKSTYMYIDDGTEEVKAYFKKGANINNKLYKVGDLIKLVGLVGRGRSGYRILPRGESDIVKIGAVKEAAVTLRTPRKSGQKEVAEKYLTATAGGLSSILIGLLIKSKGSVFGKILKKVGNIVLARVRWK